MDKTHAPSNKPLGGQDNVMQDDELRQICSLPGAFPKSGLGWRELVRQSPYPANQASLTENRLASFLETNPDLVELWLAWSEDKRSTPSPFFRRSGSRYEVGYIERDGHFQPSEYFDEPAQACAKFMLRELAGAIVVGRRGV
jgi:hypothetical protein